MNKTVYDIYISYRRDGGGATAGRINDMLTSDGYSVGYDVDTLREGRFDDQLPTRIEQRQQGRKRQESQRTWCVRHERKRLGMVPGLVRKLQLR